MVEIKDPLALRGQINMLLTELVRPFCEKHDMDLTMEQETTLDMIDKIICSEFDIDRDKFPNVD